MKIDLHCIQVNNAINNLLTIDETDRKMNPYGSVTWTSKEHFSDFITKVKAGEFDHFVS
jgi:hypothetical protein